MESDNNLLELLKKYFNYTKFKSDIQENAIKAIVAGKKDVYISMPTGSGKSLCYQLPALFHDNKVAIVISPLIALIKNQVDYLQSRKIRAHTINSTTGSKERDSIYGDLKAKKTETKFLYITPEQAATHTFQDLFSLLVRFNKISLVAVDEAHCVSSWGHDFRKDYLKLGKWRREYSDIQWLALTATAPLKVREDVLENLGFKNPSIFQVSCFRHNLYYDIIYKNSIRDDFIELKNFIDKCLSNEMSMELKGHEKPCAIVYCRKKDTTESVALGLRKQGLACKAFHSGLKTSEKEKVQNEWMDGTISVIVATISFGMGIDKAQVRVVVHWDISQNIAAYYQESGRAGRDGKKSYCRLYYDRDEVKTIMFILNQDLSKCKDEKSDKYLRAKNAIKEFGKIVDHCESAACRHLLFTKYFGDKDPKCDSMCDYCKNKTKCKEKLEKFQKISTGYSTTIQMDDHTDLYEGGKSDYAKRGTFDDYNDFASSEDDSYRKNVKEKKSERTFIDKQFALRKMQAASAMSNRETTAISKVKQASLTDTKVCGLSLSTRESNLTLLVSTLKNNKEYFEIASPPEYPLHSLVYKDLEDIGIEIEYNCFNSCKAVSIYRKNIAKEIYGIRTCKTLYPGTKNHVPNKHKSHGGDYKTIVKDLRERYGKDVIDELEDELEKNKPPKRISKIKESNRYDGKTQSKINEFFQAAPASSSSSNEVVEISSQDESVNAETLTINDSSPDDTEDPEILKLELKKQDLVNALSLMDEKSRDEDDDVIEIKDDALVSQLPEKVQNESETVSENLRIKTSEHKRRIEDSSPTSATDSPSKKLKNNNEFRKASDMMTTNNSFPTAISCDNATVTEEINRKRKRNKNKISEMVVQSLNPFYRDKKISGPDPKTLFKLMARKITHHFFESDQDKIPESKLVRNRIRQLFSISGVVKSIEDVELDD